jgi:hypothetical protein
MADRAKGMYHRATIRPSFSTAAGVDAYALRPGPEPKKSPTGTATWGCAAPSKVMVNRQRARASSRSSASIFSQIAVKAPCLFPTSWRTRVLPGAIGRPPLPGGTSATACHVSPGSLEHRGRVALDGRPLRVGRDRDLVVAVRHVRVRPGRASSDSRRIRPRCRLERTGGCSRTGDDNRSTPGGRGWPSPPLSRAAFFRRRAPSSNHSRGT